MVLYPEVQERAQAELDALLAGEHRLPDFKDREQGKTPYLEAVVSEILRWNPVTPLGESRFCHVWCLQVSICM